MDGFGYTSMTDSVLLDARYHPSSDGPSQGLPTGDGRDFLSRLTRPDLEDEPSTHFKPNVGSNIAGMGPEFLAASARSSSRTFTSNGTTSKAERVSEILAQCLDDTHYYDLRLVCRYWDMQITAATPPKFPAVYRLPVEILQDMYWYLGPTDFAAARNTCHNWRYASMDSRVLSIMLKRGGWWSGAEAEAKRKKEEVLNSSDSLIEAFLSSRLAREVALLPDSRTCDPKTQIASVPHSQAQNEKAAESYLPALPKASLTDMSELGPVPAGKDCDHGCGLTFTISACGRFLLVAETNNILVYELGNPRLVPVTSIICPRRVLATSMDTSAQRFAVAALLEERMGLVCDLDLDEVHREPPAPEVYTDASLRTPRNRGSTEEHDVNDDDESVPLRRREILATAARKRLTHREDDNDHGRVNSIHIRSPNQSVSLINASHRHANQEWHDRVIPFAGLDPIKYINPRPFSDPSAAQTHAIYNARSGGISNRTMQNLMEAIPISPAALSIYNSLCSHDDPPRSVAICPSRRCVAFGCEAGVELHWVDARGGRNLMKWFPLSAPSECLYFLPPRTGALDGPNKLRLISSKVGPGQRERSQACRGSAMASAGGNRRRMWNLWPWPMDTNNSSGPFYRSSSARDWDADSRDDRGSEYDHYSAVPLSDGVHLLFTDPKTGCLALGSDAPLGGSTKLLRKVKFVPPSQIIEEHGSKLAGSKHAGSAAIPMPNDYAVGMDLTHGVRVVAVYGTDKIVLYNLPPDVFADVSRVGGNGVVAGHEQGDEWQFGDWAWWWDARWQDYVGRNAGAAARSSTSDGAIGSSLSTLGPYPVEQSHEGQRGYPRSVWPVVVKGTLLACVRNVVEVGIQNEGCVRENGLAVWAFTRDAVAHTWRTGCCGERSCLRKNTPAFGYAKSRNAHPAATGPNDILDNSRPTESYDTYISARSSCPVHRVVERNGLVVDVMERQGDWVIRDIWGNDPILERPSQRNGRAVQAVGDRDSSNDEEDEARHSDRGNRPQSLEWDGDVRMGGMDGVEEGYDYPCIAPWMCRPPRLGLEEMLMPELSDLEVLNSPKRTDRDVLPGDGLFMPGDDGLQEVYMSDAPTWTTIDQHCQTIMCDPEASRRLRQQSTNEVHDSRNDLAKVTEKVRRLRLESSEECTYDADMITESGRASPPSLSVTRNRMLKEQWDRYGSLRRASPRRAILSGSEPARNLKAAHLAISAPRPPPSSPAETLRSLPPQSAPSGPSTERKRKKLRSSSAGDTRPLSQRPKLTPVPPRGNQRRMKSSRPVTNGTRVVSAPIIDTTINNAGHDFQRNWRGIINWCTQCDTALCRFGNHGLPVEVKVEKRCVSARA